MRIYVLGAILLGLVANIAVALAAPPGKTLSIKAKPSPVVFGRTATLSGKLTGTGHAGKTIQLQADAYPFDSKFKNVATTTTNNAGSWTATDKPLVNTHYRAKQGPTESSIITELVRIRVSLRLSDSTPKAGSRSASAAGPAHSTTARS